MKQFQISNFKCPRQTRLSQISNENHWKLEIRNLRFFQGFTLIELILTLGILTTLFAIIVISLSYIDQKTASNAKIDVITAEIKSQQIKAMTGDAGSAGTTADQGIYFQQNSYTVFRGSTYSSSNPSNFVVPLASNLEFSVINLPGNQIIFEQASGIVSNYDASKNTVTLRNTTNSQTFRITINRLGTMTAVDTL